MGVAIQMTTVEGIIVEMLRLQKSLPPRPSLDDLEAALVEIKKADMVLASRLEELLTQRRSDGVPAVVFDSFQELKKDILEEQAREQKRAAEAIIKAEERHRRFDSLIQKVYSALTSSSGLLDRSDEDLDINKLASISPSIKPNLEENKIACQDRKLDSLDSGPFTKSAGGTQSDLKSQCLVKSESFGRADLTSVLSRSFSPGGLVPTIIQHRLSNSEEVLTPDTGVAIQTPSKVLSMLNVAMTRELKILDLHGAFLHELEWVPESIGQLTWLTELNLSGNRLASIPGSIGELRNLKVLDLSTNLLTSLPDSLGNLTSLETLKIENNKIEELPWTIGQCTALVELNADFNKLKALPEALGNLGCLRNLSVHLNSLRSLPTSMASMTSLTELDAHFNELESVPESLCLVTSLMKLNIASNFNDLKELPQLIGRLQRLKELDASCNHLTELPDSFAMLTNLQELRLEGNPLRVPPLHIVEQGKEAVLQYMAEHVAQKEHQQIHKKKKGKLTCLFSCLFNTSKRRDPVDRVDLGIMA
eukprot:c26617_g1_i1 orf=301-1902(-)